MRGDGYARILATGADGNNTATGAAIWTDELLQDHTLKTHRVFFEQLVQAVQENALLGGKDDA